MRLKAIFAALAAASGATFLAAPASAQMMNGNYNGITQGLYSTQTTYQGGNRIRTTSSPSGYPGINRSYTEIRRTNYTNCLPGQFRC